MAKYHIVMCQDRFSVAGHGKETSFTEKDFNTFVSFLGSDVSFSEDNETGTTLLASTSSKPRASAGSNSEFRYMDYVDNSTMPRSLFTDNACDEKCLAVKLMKQTEV